MSAIAINLQAVRQRIEHAAQAAGRQPTAIRLLAVSKTWPAASLCKTIAAGQGFFGKNYVQEALESKSHDLEAAVAEGATLVRIGTAIFGERNYA